MKEYSKGIIMSVSESDANEYTIWSPKTPSTELQLLSTSSEEFKVRFLLKIKNNSYNLAWRFCQFQINRSK